MSNNIVISGTIFAFGAPDSHCYIRVIVISKIVISGFPPIHFTVTFAGTKVFHRYIKNIVISKIEDRYIGVPL